MSLSSLFQWPNVPSNKGSCLRSNWAKDFCCSSVKWVHLLTYASMSSLTYLASRILLIHSVLSMTAWESVIKKPVSKVSSILLKGIEASSHSKLWKFFFLAHCYAGLNFHKGKAVTISEGPRLFMIASCSTLFKAILKTSVFSRSRSERRQKALALSLIYSTCQDKIIRLINSRNCWMLVPIPVVTYDCYHVPYGI